MINLPPLHHITSRLVKLFRSVWALPVCLSVFKLWLTNHLPIQAAFAPHDNLRYAEMAFEIWDFKPPFFYNQYILMRQPGYPFFIRINYLLGLPLKFSQELLHIAVGFFFAWSVYKYYRQKPVVVLFLSLYILAPASFIYNRNTLQEAVYLPLTVFVVSCLIHLLNAQFDRKNFLKWSALLGIGLAWFWNTRPEGIWIIPACIIVYTLIIAKAFRLGQSLRILIPRLGYSLACVAIPVILVTLSLSLTTYLKYGIFNTNDVTAPGIKQAYSNLINVTTDTWRARVPVTQATRSQIYAVSPTFAKLSSYLEGKGRDWYHFGCTYYRICDDYTGGWFIWAMREAVAQAGEYKTATATEAFYQQMTREIKTACSSSQLKCKNSNLWLSSFAPTDSEYLGYFLHSLDSVSHTLVNGISVIDLSSGQQDDFIRKKYEVIAREPAEILSDRSKSINQQKDKLITFISTVYQYVFPILLGSALLGLILQHLSSWNYRNIATEVPLHVLWIFLSCVVVRVGLVAYIDATSFPGDFRYLWPAAPLLLMSVSIGVSYLTRVVHLLRQF